MEPEPRPEAASDDFQRPNVDPPPSPGEEHLPAGDADPAPEMLDTIPYARPVLWARRASLELPRISGLRALLELVLLAVAYAAGTLAIIPLESIWQPADERWLSIPATLISGATVTAVCLTLLHVDGQRLRSVGLTHHRLAVNAGIGVGAYVAVMIGLLAMSVVTMLLFPEIMKSQEQAVESIRSTFPELSLPAAALFMAYVAIWEELAFRGFMLTRLQVLLKRWWLTLPIGSLLFGIGHLWQSPVALVTTTGLGFVLALLFLWRRSLVPCIVLHAINNTVSILILRTLA